MTEKHHLQMPTLFHETLVASGVLDVERWWAAIDDTDRAEAIQFWGTLASEVLSGFRIVAVPDNDPEAAIGYWHNDFYEYLINHEVHWFDEPKLHVCHATHAAHDCLVNGMLPAGFSCPLSSSECHMEQMLRRSGGRGVRLALVPTY